MTAYFVRNDDQSVSGPYEAEQIRGWIAEGRLTRDAPCSADGKTWTPASGVEEIFATPRKAAAASQAFPEPSLLIRQGANVQGPYAMTRIRGYVAQRRVQPYMLFSQDGIFWVGPEHVPGLIPEGYVAVAPPNRPTAVPSDATTAAAGSGAGRSSAAASAPTPPPAPGKDVGSTTLFGYTLDEADMAPKSIPASRVAPVAATSAPPAPSAAPAEPTYYVRDDAQTVYGPYTEEALREWISEGRVRPDMELSLDGRRWMLGTQMPALFDAAIPSRVPGSQGSADSSDVIEEARPAERSSAWRRFRGRR